MSDDTIPVSSGKNVKPKLSVSTNNETRANDSIASAKNESFTKTTKSRNIPPAEPKKKK